MNKLLNYYCTMLIFCKGRPSTLSQLNNWELNGIILHINKYPQGLLNGYSKSEYINAVNYILKCRSQIKNHKIVIIETRLANKSLIIANELSNLLLRAMINTEQCSKRKLVLT